MKLYLTALIVIAGVLITSIVWAAEQKAKSEGKTEEEAYKAPEGTVNINEEGLFMLDEELYEHLIWAKDSFIKKDMKSAAQDIRKGAEFLKLEYYRAIPGEDKTGLETSCNELNKLAAEVEKGAIASETDLTRKFAIAQHDLANHFYLKAEEAWKAKNEKNTGRYLKSAVVNVEHTYEWVGQDLGPSEKVFQEARDLSLRLIEKSAKTPAEVDKTLAAIKTEIDNLNKKLK